MKILNVNKDEIIKRLTELNCIKVFDGPMNSVYLDVEDENKFLRIRKKGEKEFITLKLDKGDNEMKINEEHEIEIKDFDTARKIFNELGFKEFSTDFRERISYKLRNSLVEINLYKNIPHFLEVESPNKEELKEIVELLGFTMNETNNWSGKDVINYYKR